MSLEEKRKKFGMEVRPSIHKRLKQWAIDNDVPLYVASERAFLSLLNGATEANYSPRHKTLHDKLESILNSGDAMTIQAVTPNIDVFYDRLQPSLRKTGTRER